MRVYHLTLQNQNKILKIILQSQLLYIVSKIDNFRQKFQQNQSEIWNCTYSILKNLSICLKIADDYVVADEESHSVKVHMRLQLLDYLYAAIGQIKLQNTLIVLKARTIQTVRHHHAIRTPKKQIRQNDGSGWFISAEYFQSLDLDCQLWNHRTQSLANTPSRLPIASTTLASSQNTRSNILEYKIHSAMPLTDLVTALFFLKTFTTDNIFPTQFIDKSRNFFFQEKSYFGQAIILTSIR